MPKKTEEVQEAPPQLEARIVDERPAPKALVSLIENGNRELQETQQRLMNEITTASNELLELMSLKQEDGWLLDIEGLRFVKVERPVQ